MTEIDLGGFERCTLLKEVEIRGEKFYFQPLPVKAWPYLVKLQQKIWANPEISKELEKNPEKFWEYIDDEALDILYKLIEMMIYSSYPKLDSRDATTKQKIDAFIRSNFIQLVSTLMELITEQQEVSSFDIAKQKAEEIKERILQKQQQQSLNQ